jgi:hypothetical protein
MTTYACHTQIKPYKRVKRTINGVNPSSGAAADDDIALRCVDGALRTQQSVQIDTLHALTLTLKHCLFSSLLTSSYSLLTRQTLVLLSM